MASFKERLTNLGFSSYTEYLDSDHWQDFRKRYKANKYASLRCAVCDCTTIQLHHHTYWRLGCEFLADVTPLCRKHHVQVHEILKKKKWKVGKTSKVVDALKFKIWKSSLSGKTSVEVMLLCAKKARQDALDECKTLISQGFWTNIMPSKWVPTLPDKKLFRYARSLRLAKRRKLVTPPL